MAAMTTTEMTDAVRKYFKDHDNKWMTSAAVFDDYFFDQDKVRFQLVFSKMYLKPPHEMVKQDNPAGRGSIWRLRTPFDAPFVDPLKIPRAKRTVVIEQPVASVALDHSVSKVAHRDHGTVAETPPEVRRREPDTMPVVHRSITDAPPNNALASGLANFKPRANGMQIVQQAGQKAKFDSDTPYEVPAGVKVETLPVGSSTVSAKIKGAVQLPFVTAHAEMVSTPARPAGLTISSGWLLDSFFQQREDAVLTMHARANAHPDCAYRITENPDSGIWLLHKREYEGSTDMRTWSQLVDADFDEVAPKKATRVVWESALKSAEVTGVARDVPGRVVKAHDVEEAAGATAAPEARPSPSPVEGRQNTLGSMLDAVLGMAGLALKNLLRDAMIEAITSPAVVAVLNPEPEVRYEASQQAIKPPEIKLPEIEPDQVIEEAKVTQPKPPRHNPEMPDATTLRVKLPKVAIIGLAKAHQEAEIKKRFEKKLDIVTIHPDVNERIIRKFCGSAEKIIVMVDHVPHSIEHHLNHYNMAFQKMKGGIDRLSGELQSLVH